MSPEVPAIITKDLSKQYVVNGPYALKELNIQVKRGEVYGFLGPNGAGKSTTIRLLLNFIQPTRGTAQILGNDIVQQTVELKKSVGYLSGDFRAYEKLTGHQFLQYMSELQPLKRPSYKQQLAKLFNLDLSKRIGTLSKGNRQKVGIIQAFMHEPDILILDEPTDGLDPFMQETFYNLTRESKKRGATIFVSSHNLPEVQKMCDRVGIIKNGILVSESTIAELIEQASQTFYITFKDKPPLSSLKKVGGVKILTTEGNKVSLQARGDLSPLLTLLAKSNVVALTTRELDLEKEFMRYYEGEKS
jgi:ABC-2 type transport system ATP-binding protein